MTNKQLQAIVDKLQNLIDAAEDRIGTIDCEHENECKCEDRSEALETKRDACQEALDALEGVMD